MADDDSVVVCRGEIVGCRFLRLGSSFYGGSTLVFREMNCVIYIYDHFRYPCHFGNHIPSLRVDLMCAVFMCVAGNFGNGMAGNAWVF